MIGGVNNGWAVAMSLLGYERGEAAATMPVMFRGEFDRLLELARDRGRNDDPTIRQRLAQGYIEVGDHAPARHAHAHRFPRRQTARVRASRPSSCTGPSTTSGSPSSRSTSWVRRRWCPTGPAPTSSFHTDNPGAPNQSASWIGTFYNARAGTIYAGTSQVQRNILGEMVLGLPKEPRAQGLTPAA